MTIKSLIAAAAMASALAVPAAAFEPRNAECIAPANPGGGWDFTCRTVGRLLTEEGLVPGNVQVTNMPGAVGAVAYANVASNRSDDPDLVVATSTVAMAQIAQDKYPAGTDAMRWVAMLGADVGTLLVRADSEHENLESFLSALREDPSSVVAGGSSSIGGWDHLRFLMLAEEAGVPAEELQSIRWVQFEGGGDAVTQLLGGQLDVVLTDIGEIGGFIQSGDVDALAVMSDERLQSYPEVATAREQGIEVEGYNWRGFYMGGEAPDEAYDGWLAILEDLYETEAWKEAATASGLTPIWRGGDEFEAFVDETTARMEELSRAIGIIQ